MPKFVYGVCCTVFVLSILCSVWALDEHRVACRQSERDNRASGMATTTQATTTNRESAAEKDNVDTSMTGSTTTYEKVDADNPTSSSNVGRENPAEGESDAIVQPRESGVSETTSSGTNETSSSAVSDQRSPLETLYIDITKPGLGSPMTEPVFKENSLSGLFNSCRIDNDDSRKTDNSSDCYEDDAYNDRLTFEMSFRFPASSIERAFEENPPSLEILGDSLMHADPAILSAVVQATSSTAKVSVGYACKTDSSGVLSLRLRVHFNAEKEDSVSILWKKICMSGRNDKMEFGYLVNEKGQSTPTKQEFPKEGDAPLEVVPNDVSTEVFLKLEQPGAQQVFLAPYVISSNPDVTPVSVRGNHPSGAVLEGLEQTSFQVSYDCATKGTSDISVTVGIPPFNNLTATWKKDCGGHIATNLQAGTSEGAHDVVENGKATSQYMVGIENIGTEHSEEHMHLPGNVSGWTVYLSNSQNSSTGLATREAALHLGRIALTVEHPENVAASAPRVRERGAMGWRDLRRSEYLLDAGHTLQVSFHFLCRRLGESRILITVPVLQYDMLEFGIAKECTHVGTAHRSRELVWTVENVMWAGLFVCLVGVAFWWWTRRKNATKGFEPLPVTER